ncbi:MAG: hypothetical protein K0S49_1859, partial [Microbacterium sp.]|nr:hypothetical protein [Microbacterium sp.]
QPDFSYLAPGEVKTFSQFWFPITGIGAAHQATKDAAVSVRLEEGHVHIGVAVTSDVPGARVRVTVGDDPQEHVVDLGPGRPWIDSVPCPHGVDATRIEVVVHDGDRELIRWRPRSDDDGAPEPAVATEPPLPADIASADELYLTGVHLAQYRHPTRHPEPYWEEALRRDSGDARSNTALGASAYARGEYDVAAGYLRAAVERLTFRNPNPADGEAHYRLGLVETRRGHDAGAYDAFAKAAWDVRWAHPASVQMGLLDARAGRDLAALGRLDDALRHGSDDPLARNVRDRLDVFTAYLARRALPDDGLMLLDLAGDLARAGQRDDALAVLAAAAGASATGTGGIAPVAEYMPPPTLAIARSAHPLTGCFPRGSTPTTPLKLPLQPIRLTRGRGRCSACGSTTAAAGRMRWCSGVRPSTTRRAMACCCATPRWPRRRSRAISTPPPPCTTGPSR